MKKLQLLFICMGLITFKVQAQTEFQPVIKGFGKVFEVPFAEDKPDPTMEYKIVVEVGEKIDNPSEIYAPLEHVARMFNLHVYGGVPQKQIHVALVIWGYQFQS